MPRRKPGQVPLELPPHLGRYLTDRRPRGGGRRSTPTYRGFPPLLRPRRADGPWRPLRPSATGGPRRPRGPRGPGRPRSPSPPPRGAPASRPDDLRRARRPDDPAPPEADPPGPSLSARRTAKRRWSARFPRARMESGVEGSSTPSISPAFAIRRSRGEGWPPPAVAAFTRFTARADHPPTTPDDPFPEGPLLPMLVEDRTPRE